MANASSSAKSLDIPSKNIRKGIIVGSVKALVLTAILCQKIEHKAATRTTWVIPIGITPISSLCIKRYEKHLVEVGNFMALQ
ncbi:MAG TPA: hypothetical protein VKU94_03610 [Geobacterales bacterium]|nr:hypothetical protein [Geobacterales bacterium]